MSAIIGEFSNEFRKRSIIYSIDETQVHLSLGTFDVAMQFEKLIHEDDYTGIQIWLINEDYEDVDGEVQYFENDDEPFDVEHIVEEAINLAKNINAGYGLLTKKMIELNHLASEYDLSRKLLDQIYSEKITID